MKDDNSDKLIQQLYSELTFVHNAKTHSKIHYENDTNKYEILNAKTIFENKMDMVGNDINEIVNIKKASEDKKKDMVGKDIHEIVNIEKASEDKKKDMVGKDIHEIVNIEKASEDKKKDMVENDINEIVNIEKVSEDKEKDMTENDINEIENTTQLLNDKAEIKEDNNDQYPIVNDKRLGDKAELEVITNTEQQNNINNLINSPKNRLVDSLTQSTGDKCFNDVLSEYDLQKKRKLYNSKDATSLEAIIPFGNNSADIGDWTYRNRKELIISMIIYLLLITVIYYTKFNVNSLNLISVVYIDVPLIEEEIIKPEKIEEERYEIEYPQEKIENTFIDENIELEHDFNSQSENESDNDLEEKSDSEWMSELDDYDNTNELYQDAIQTQLELEANRDAYETSLDDIDNITIEKNNEALSKRGLTDYFTDINQEAKNKNVSKVGNVTVSYSLHNRYVVKPNVPAYRCKGAGKIVVEISVGRDGFVTDANIKSMSRINDECLPRMAISAALNTGFNIDKYGPSKQVGLITFVFVAQ